MSKERENEVVALARQFAQFMEMSAASAAQFMKMSAASAVRSEKMLADIGRHGVAIETAVADLKKQSEWMEQAEKRVADLNGESKGIKAEVAEFKQTAERELEVMAGNLRDWKGKSQPLIRKFRD